MNICLAYALEVFFKRVFATSGEVYVPRVRPDQPKPVEKPESYGEVVAKVARRWKGSALN